MYECTIIKYICTFCFDHFQGQLQPTVYLMRVQKQAEAKGMQPNMWSTLQYTDRFECITMAQIYVMYMYKQSNNPHYYDPLL